MRCVWSGVEIQQLAEHGASASLGVLRQRQREQAGEQRVIGVVGHQERSLFCRSYQGRLRWRRILALQQPLMSAIELAPQHGAHDDGGCDQNDKENSLVAGDHCWWAPLS